jgi:tetratricopeptide (TPR) repeat protein
MNTTNRNVVIGVVVVVLILLGYLAWQERGTAAPSSSSTASSTATTTGSVITTTQNSTSTSGYTIKPIYAPTAPNYKTPLTFAAGVNATDKLTYQSQFANDETVIASNPENYSAWLDLGILREETGDYQGAAADWRYVTELYPSDPTAFADLGDLYGTYLHQSAQGITYYKEAIKLDPTKEETFYQNLAQIYSNEGDTTDAKATLQQGIDAQVVGYQNLQNELNSMQ